jgi:hypothetical protein
MAMLDELSVLLGLLNLGSPVLEPNLDRPLGHLTFLARISRTLELGDWLVKKVSSRTASCSAEALILFLEVVLVGEEADRDGNEEGSPLGEF